VASPGGEPISVSLGTPWLATAGSGDVLGGVLGALLATHAADIEERGHAALAELAATAAALHGLAAVKASGGGPIAALDIARALPGVVAALLQMRDGDATD
jgi:NAD(P)H-hydrate repair Nnr-like enzyme with NAD(P)H-hydrate dehydratase domain